MPHGGLGGGEARDGSGRSHALDAEEGIGAALVMGGSAEIGMGLIFSARQGEMSSVPETSRKQLDKLNINNQFQSFAGDNHVVVDSPRQSAELDRRISRVTIQEAHSFTSSPRSLPAALASPTSPGAHSTNVRSIASQQRVRHRPVPLRRKTVFKPPPLPSYSDQLGQRPKDQGHGGFPGPFQLFSKFLKQYFPELHQAIMKRLESQPQVKSGGKIDDSEKGVGKSFKRLTQDFQGLVIGRNSDFNTDELSDEELERLGGREYRALRTLSYLVFLYFVGTQMLTFILIAPWLSTTHSYDDVFANQFRVVNKPWFAIFQVVAAYTGGGMSLVDTAMVPFQRAYLMIFSMLFVILAGNHGLPIFAIEWSSFIVLDIGLAVTESLPRGTRAVAGLFQSFAVRASGFAIVNISALAPSFQYEEQSLGVFEPEAEDEDDEPALLDTKDRGERIGKYFGWHLRRQVAYDVWWLVWGIFLVCIIERTKLMDEENAPWFNLFRVVFELVSAFGGIGLSLGLPSDNFAFSGAFGPLSKLVVIVIMIRGRHRGLPVAVDRAILLPKDMVAQNAAGSQNQKQQNGASIVIVEENSKSEKVEQG
ncbi:hypothetical protein NLI96_g4697 [Meripilus lineatus]|uniref:Uncharacterized protein n=1 Tax=Meripilus lineatus TaxID=2056292 RepID=A0AAD5YEJ6_9APHY|nr:hypothetical protein NLI96_g4697 [Physisporinus lineatus]